MMPINPSPDRRLEALHAFIGDSDFICKIGTIHERTGQLIYSKLTPPDENNSLLSQLRGDTGQFLEKASGAWVIPFPVEPDSHEELCALSRELLAAVVSATCSNHLSGSIDETAVFSPARERIQLTPSQESSAIDSKAFTMLVSNRMAGRSFQSAGGSDRALQEVALELVDLFPNIAPTPIPERSLQLVVMSPLYHQDRSPHPDAPLLKAHDIPHPRYLPATALVVSFMDEVAEARGLPAGQQTYENVTRLGSAYNRHAAPGHDYRSNQILAPAYHIPVDAKADDILLSDVQSDAAPRLRSQFLSQSSGAVDQAQLQALQELSEQLPPVVLAYVRAHRIDTNPTALMMVLEQFNLLGGDEQRDQIQ